MGDDFQPRFSIQHSVGSQWTQFMRQSSVALVLDIISSSHLRLAGTFLWLSCLRSTGKLCLLGDDCSKMFYSAPLARSGYTLTRLRSLSSRILHIFLRELDLGCSRSWRRLRSAGNRILTGRRLQKQFRTCGVCIVGQWPHVHASIYGCLGIFMRFHVKMDSDPVRTENLYIFLVRLHPAAAWSVSWCRLRGTTVDTCTYVSPGGLRTNLHSVPLEGGLWILRSMLAGLTTSVWGSFFAALCTGTGPGGLCHQGVCRVAQTSGTCPVVSGPAWTDTHMVPQRPNHHHH